MTAVLVVPADILKNVRQRWPHIADVWASHVETEFRALCDQHQATPQTVLPARYGLVVAADTAGGPLVLRSSPDPHGAEQAAVATALANLGISPTVHRTLATAHGTWTVMDRVCPGTPLYAADPATVTLESLFAPLAAMHRQPAPQLGMASILDWLRNRLEDDQLDDRRPGTSVASTGERNVALEILAELARDHTPALCHGDSSLGNIISNGAGRWMYVDPRGMTGESSYDVAVLGIRVARFRNSDDLIRRIADLAGVHLDRVTAWTTIAETARV